MLREYTVFNVDQCENLPDSVRAGRPMRVRNPDTRDALADEFLRSTGADIREGQGEAYYLPSHDFISTPAFAAFKGADHFYATAFHELTHWTGHKSRLDRNLKTRFGAHELRLRSWLPSWARRSSVPSLALTVTCDMQAISRPGLTY
jgi:antirestriction protein ArdC